MPFISPNTSRAGTRSNHRARGRQTRPRPRSPMSISRIADCQGVDRSSACRRRGCWSSGPQHTFDCWSSSSRAAASSARAHSVRWAAHYYVERHRLRLPAAKTEETGSGTRRRRCVQSGGQPNSMSSRHLAGPIRGGEIMANRWHWESRTAWRRWHIPALVRSRAVVWRPSLTYSGYAHYDSRRLWTGFRASGIEKTRFATPGTSPR